jgi:hypothetical protein
MGSTRRGLAPGHASAGRHTDPDPCASVLFCGSFETAHYHAVGILCARSRVERRRAVFLDLFPKFERVRGGVSRANRFRITRLACSIGRCGRVRSCRH